MKKKKGDFVMHDTIKPKIYFATIWSTEVGSNIDIEGEELTSESKLPKKDLNRYGTHDNDKSIERIIVTKEVVKYDWLTTKQTVEVYNEEEKYELKRDLRLIIWEGFDNSLNLLDNYRIITPKFFRELVKIKELESREEEFSHIEILPDLAPLVNKKEMELEIS